MYMCIHIYIYIYIYIERERERKIYVFTHGSLQAARGGLARPAELEEALEQGLEPQVTS